MSVLARMIENSSRRFASCLGLALCVSFGPAGVAPASAAPDAPSLPPGARNFVRLSGAAERMFREKLAAGYTLPEAFVRRFGLDLGDYDPAFESPAPADQLGIGRAGAQRVEVVGLGADVQVNDRTGDVTCSTNPGCANRPLGQAETTIATLGSLMLAGWNDTKGFCPPYGAVQGYGYSSNGGATWTDGGDVPTPIVGARWRGDPVHAVNRKTGAFFIAGLFEDPTNSNFAPTSGISVARGHFSGGSFVFDLNAKIATGGGTVADPNFLDKEWIAVDSLSGNVYITYSNFKNLGTTGGLSQVEFIRSLDNGATWSAPLVLNSVATNGLIQGSRPVVGPAGEVYVVWYEYGFPQSHLRIRKSTDFGVSFGAEHTVADFYENGFSGSPGFRRGGAVTLPSLAADCGSGPHRGRVYVAWDEGLNWTNNVLSTASPKSEVENNASFANATPFTVGNLLRGSFSNSADVDQFRFSGTRGQTVLFLSDSASGTTINTRLVCASDTTTLNSYRFLSFNASSQPATVFTLPATGTYYLRLSDATTTLGGYRILTGFDTQGVERARDHRDRFAAWSDDGTTWSTPARLDDDDPWFDGCFPELTVDGNGTAHCFWHDFRDDPGCGALSYEYMTSSNDGGLTWGPNRRVSDEQSFWSINACGSANQGDYQGITSEGSRVSPCWADSRLGDPDVFIESPVFAQSGVCPGPRAGAVGSVQIVTFTLQNTGSVPGTFTWALTDDAGWLTGATPSASGSVGLAASATQNVVASVQMPAQCTPLLDNLRFVIADANIPGRKDTCFMVVHCVSSTDAPVRAVALNLAPPHPNPSLGRVEFRFGLSRDGEARLAVYGASGARIRTLVSGARPAGDQSVAWDGRDESGRRVAPGVYFVRLDAEGRHLERVVSLVR